MALATYLVMLTAVLMDLPRSPQSPRCVLKALILHCFKPHSFCFFPKRSDSWVAPHLSLIGCIMQALATTFADGFADVVSECYQFCEIEVSGFAFATADIIAAAYEQVNVDMCTGQFPPPLAAFALS